MNKYNDIFFDLDRTLWDFDKNASETLDEVFVVFKLNQLFNIELQDFITAYLKTNEAMWKDYQKNKLSREVLRNNRFLETFKRLRVQDDVLANEVSKFYIANCPLKTNLIPHTNEILAYLNEHYQLHIITNGFADSQHIKLNTTGLKKYFNHIIISEEVGYKKPSRKVFEHAVKLVNGKVENSLMIGDNLRVDIGGAAGAGMDQVYYNPKNSIHRKKVTYQISCLSELRTLL